MTDVSTATATATDLVACAHCGHPDNGTYCSGCGKELAGDAHQTVLHEVWEMLVVDRLTDAREFATTTWHLVAKPLRFFRTVLARPAARASHVFPEPVPEALPRGLVQAPVKFYVLSFVTSLLVSKITGAEIQQWIPGVDDDFNNELSLLVLLVLFGLYGMMFRWTSGRRISAEEAAIVSSYTVGAAAAINAVLSMVPRMTTVAGLIAMYLMIGIPLIVLPRLYRMSRRRVFVAQVAAALGAMTVIATLLYGITEAVKSLA